MLGRVLVVGGSASVAPEIIKVMVAGSSRVLVTYRSLPVEIQSKLVDVYECDLINNDSRRSLIASIDKGGGIDVVILLVGAILGKDLASSSDDEMLKLANANFLGPAALLRELLPVLNENARILIVSSVSGQRGSYDPVYAGTKGALIPFAKSLATWLGKRLTVTVVAPGAIEDSSMVRDMAPERVSYHRNASPTGSLLSCQDFAKVLYDLAHPHWSHSNGAVINLNGGSYV